MKVFQVLFQKNNGKTGHRKVKARDEAEAKSKVRRMVRKTSNKNKYNPFDLGREIHSWVEVMEVKPEKKEEKKKVIPDKVWVTYNFYCKDCGIKVSVQGFCPDELLCSKCFEK